MKAVFIELPAFDGTGQTISMTMLSENCSAY